MNLNLRFFTFLESIFLVGWKRLRQVRLPRFLHFLRARQDDGLCKRKTGFEIYSEMASIHGFHIFVGAKTWQRILWWCVICLAVLMSVIVITMLLMINQDRPTTRFIESMMIPTSEMPFPAITICNMNRISRKSLLKKARELNVTEKTLREINGFSVGNITNLNWTQLFEELAPKICSQIVNCKWEGDAKICHNLLHSVWTQEQRICCSFSKQSQLYTSHYGSAKGLSLLLDPQTEDYGNVNFASSGFEILVHESQAVVSDATQRFYVPSGSEAHLMIKVFGTHSGSQLRSLPLDKRRCYLKDERQLFHFDVYRQINCLAECRSERLYGICGCLPSHLPRQSDWPVCQVDQFKCLQLHATDLAGEIIDKESGSYLCNCLPPCDFYRYVIQSDVRRMYNYSETGSNSSQKVLVHAYFDSPIAEQIRLDVSENWLQFIGNIGGITGLFMGCSFVSVFELIFFTCVRPTCNWLTRQQIRYRLQLARRTKTQVGPLVQPN
ncbi:pickpocket protein 11 [Drosophila tropicalis]|uniref:pickpocket protein 11 n=1 Tax=Drosophila tropicalis TaxID=46794 RepID=UPI0035ABC2D7